MYSGRTNKELAVLKWHKVGCYATAFASIPPTDKGIPDKVLKDDDFETSMDITRQEPGNTTVQQRRDDKAQTTHWLAAGAKDGKVSLWDIY